MNLKTNAITIFIIMLIFYRITNFLLFENEDNDRILHDVRFSNNSNYIQHKKYYVNKPKIFVGVMITENTPKTRIDAYRSSIPTNLKNIDLHLFFVQGIPTKNTTLEHDIIVLNQKENMNEGKTFFWFQFASQKIMQLDNVHPMSGIVKMDVDVAVNWTAFDEEVFVNLQSNYFVGRINTFQKCGEYSHCPPLGCNDFRSECWIYMSGGWYLLSLSVSYALTNSCPYATEHMVGYEDLQVGLWIKNCYSNTSVFHVDNGIFFCHAGDISDTNIQLSEFSNNDCKKR